MQLINPAIKKKLDRIFKNKKIGIVGVGESNLSVISLLLKYGFSNLVLFDENKNIKTTLEKKKIKLKSYLGEKAFLKIKNFDILIISPGISPYRNEIQKVKKEGVKIISEIWLFFFLCPGKIIGVTGTNGKTTTVHLIYQVLKNLKKRIWLLGNVGKPALLDIEKIKKEDLVVLELSSFQLYYLSTLKKSPFISVVLNIQKDHLDWHKNFQNYIKAKEKILLFHNKNDFVILNYDEKITRTFKNKTKASTLYFSLKKKLPLGAFMEKENVVVNFLKNEQKICSKNKIKLKGEHNLQNIMATVLCGIILKVSIDKIRKTIINFQSLPHRIEFIRQINKIKFYNDSKSTTPASTIAAIKTFKEPKILIIGGKNKGFDFKDLAKTASKNLVKIIIVFGENKNIIKKDFLKYQNKVKIIEGKNLQQIVKIVFKEAQKNDIKIVLFSPASASFDMFKNYEERGNLYKKLVKDIAYDKKNHI